MFNKMSRQNTFWNKIKCYVTLHTVLVIFSHVFPAASKCEGAERIQEEVCSSASIMVLLSRTCFKCIWRQLMQWHCARRMIAVWLQSTEKSYREQTAPTDLYYNEGSTCFRITLVILWCHALIICALSNTHTSRPLFELQNADFSPPPLRKNKIMK